MSFTRCKFVRRLFSLSYAFVPTLWREHMSKNNSEAIIFIDENVSSKTVHLETFKEVLQWTIRVLIIIIIIVIIIIIIVIIHYLLLFGQSNLHILYYKWNSNLRKAKEQLPIRIHLLFSISSSCAHFLKRGDGWLSCLSATCCINDFSKSLPTRCDTPVKMVACSFDPISYLLTSLLFP